MRIGILTLPLHTNYGGILQAYALQTVLERMGHEVKVMDISHKAVLKWYKAPLSYGRRILSKFTTNPIPIFFEQKFNKEQESLRVYTNQFINKYIHIYRKDSFKSIQREDFDAIIVGSDQIWRPKYIRCLFYNQPIENCYLLFAKKWNIKRISYAASFGTDIWEYSFEDTSECSKLVKLFDSVSVREESAIDLCKNYFDIDAIHVLDPTLLLTKDDYISLLNLKKALPSQGNMMLYILDETTEIKVLVENIVQKYGYIPFRTNSNMENKNLSIEQRIQPPVEQWLRGFYDAELIVTDSFHACVFSILFGKPFIVIGNGSRGMSRFKSLLRMFDLEYRLWSEQIDIGLCLNPISDKTYDLLREWRIKSFAFLKNNLS